MSNEIILKMLDKINSFEEKELRQSAIVWVPIIKSMGAICKAANDYRLEIEHCMIDDPNYFFEKMTHALDRLAAIELPK